MIYVKVYGRRGTSEVHRLEKFPASIGRALENAIVVNDRSVSSQHAVIECDDRGIYHIRDLESTNGLFENGQRRRIVELSQTKSVRVGKIWLEISNSEEPVEDTVRFNPEDLAGEQGWTHGRGWLICGGLIVAAILLRYLDYRFLRVSFTTHALLTKSLSFVMAAFGLTAALSIFSKVHRRSYQFYPLFAIILGFSILGDLHFTLFNLLAFNLDSQTAAKWLDALITGAVIFFGCVMLGRLLFPETPARKRAVFVFVGILAINGASFGLRSINERDQSTDVDTIIALPLRSFPAEKHGLELINGEIDVLEKEIESASKDVLKKESEREKDAVRLAKPQDQSTKK